MAIGIIGLIIIVAFFVRVYKLSDIPNGAHIDEVATEVDAYNLLMTGVDSHNQRWPLFFNHYDEDYVEWMYTYLTIPFVKLFGPGVLAVRIPAALVGTLSIYIFYLLAKELFNRNVGLLTAALAAISPWHLQFSRLGFRAVLAPLFISLALYLFIKALKAPKNFVWLGVVLGLSLHTYSVMRLFIPLMILVLAVGFYWQLLEIFNRSKKYFLIGVFIFIVLAVPIYNFAFFQGGNDRFYEISIVGQANPVSHFMFHYLQHLSPQFLFLTGDANPWHSIPYFGQTLLVLAPFILLAYSIPHSKQREVLLLSAVFASALIPASLTDQGIPHALRAIIAVPTLEMLAAFGIYLTNKTVTKAGVPGWFVTCAITAIISYNAALFMYNYFVIYPKTVYVIDEQPPEIFINGLQ